MLEVGKPAPSFTLPDQDGKHVSLDSLKGRRVVLYFYPKDDTPGCTIEACEFTTGLKQFESLNATVYGCSADDAESHRKFTAKHKLAVGLLTDADNSVMTAYGAYGDKLLYGKTVRGVIRSTVLIDEQGIVAAHWPKVSAEGHAAEVAGMIARLAGVATGSVVVVAAGAPVKSRKPAAKKVSVAPAAAAPVAVKAAPKKAAKKGSKKSKAAKTTKPASKAKAGVKAKAKVKATAKSKKPAGKAAVKSAARKSVRSTTKNSVAKKPAGKKPPAKKPVAKKPVVKTTTAKTSTAKAKPMAKRPTAKRPARSGKR